jgi:hypothetical protein
MSELLLRLAQLKYPTFPLKVTVPQATVSSFTCKAAQELMAIVHGPRNVLFRLRLRRRIAVSR